MPLMILFELLTLIIFIISFSPFLIKFLESEEQF